MEAQIFWIVAFVFVAAVAVLFYALGTRAQVAVAGGDCEVNSFWFLGWYVECKGGASCPSGSCKLQYRSAGMDHWADADATSMKWSKGSSYRCVCG